MSLLHFKLEGNYPNSRDLPSPKILKDALQYIDNYNSTPENIHSLAEDIVFNLRREYAHMAWVIDIADFRSFYGRDKQECIHNLQLREQHYETGVYYCFAIVILNGNFLALEFWCLSEEFFSDSDSIYREIDV